jgi:nucleoside-diphosphate-sugar epimerase
MKVIIFGSTGPIGRTLIDILAKEEPSWEMFAVTRSASTDKFNGLKNVQVLQGDPNNREETMKLALDKDIVFSCVGFVRYEAKYWAKHWPVVVDNLLEASLQKDHQKLIFCDNLYAYGPSTKISPHSPIIAASFRSKPGVRAHIRQKFEQRMKEKPNSIAVVGGADFFGPFVTNASFLGDTFTKVIVQGKPAPICIGSKSVIHDFCYAPDFARALYTASINEKANGKFWICPHTIHNKTIQQIATDVAGLAASENSIVTAYPGWSVRMLSPFMGFMWEMIEMLPFWKNDYSVDDSDFCETFGVSATPYEDAMKAYIAFYRSIGDEGK